MDEIHRELLKKRQKYLVDNVIMEEGLVNQLKEKGVFTNTMATVLMTEKDQERQMTRMLEMIPKRGPEAYNKFMECLERDYPWVVENFKEKEEELILSKGSPDVNPDIRKTVKDYVKELAITTRINKAQQKAIEDFLCRHICIDTNLNNAKLTGNRLFVIHKMLMSAIPITSLDESDQMELTDILPENVTIEKVEKEAQHLVHRVEELQAMIDNCYDKLGVTSRDQELPELVYAVRKTLLEREIRIEEIKNQLLSQTRQVRLAKDRAKKALEASQKSEEEKDELSKSLDMLKSKIQKLQEERQRMGMKIAFDGIHNQSTSTAPSTPEMRTRSSKSEDNKKGSSRSRKHDPADP